MPLAEPLGSMELRLKNIVVLVLCVCFELSFLNFDLPATAVENHLLVLFLKM